MNPYEFLCITQNPDGSFTRLPNRWASVEANSSSEVALSKDLPLNPSLGTSLRLFRPLDPLTKKLPVILFFHGGGYVICSPATKGYHDYCCQLAAVVPALVVSIDYRLAPEHRLPAAFDDCIDALNWLKSQGLATNHCDEWIREFADLSNCFLMGHSSGSSIVYHVGLRAVDLDLSPVKIQGLFINQPYFGGVQRTESELRLINDAVLPLHVNDLMWSLGLPLDADRDHEYCNLMAGAGDERIGRLPKCLVRGYTGDPLVDRQRELAKLLESRGVHVVAKFYDGCHGADLSIPEHLQICYDDACDFVNFGGGNGGSTLTVGQSVV